MFSSKSQVERRMVGIFWDDGLVDTLSGIVVLVIGVSWYFGLVPLGVLAPVVTVPFWNPLRKWITQPRLGHVEFSDTQTTRYRSFLIWSFLVGCLTFMLATSLYFYLGHADTAMPQKQWIAAIPAWALAFLALLVSLIILVRRFIGYAGVFCLLGFFVAVFDKRPEIPMVAGGVIMTIVGLLRLFTFIRSHPVQPLKANGG